MQDIEVINMRTVTTGCAKNFTSFLKILYLIALRLPLPSFYLPKPTFYLSIHNPSLYAEHPQGSNSASMFSENYHY